MAIKINRPDGSADMLPNKPSTLDQDKLADALTSFSERSDNIAKRAKKVYEDREDNLKLIEDDSLRSSVANKDFLA